MSFQRVRISKDVTYRVRNLAGRLGLTPNIIGRIGICLSLNDPSIPNAGMYDELGQEYGRYTLLGEWDRFFIAIVQERIVRDGLDPKKDFDSQLRAHLNRGVLYFCNRVRDLGDIHELLQSVPRNISLKEERRDVEP